MRNDLREIRASTTLPFCRWAPPVATPLLLADVQALAAALHDIWSKT